MIVPGIPFILGHNDYHDVDSRKYGIAVHNTSNDATDVQEAKYATWRPDGTSSHFYVDNDSIVQSLDTSKSAGHAGSWEGNQNAIAVEITGINAWSRDRWIKSVDWDALGKTLAIVCRHHGIQVRWRNVDEMRSNPQVSGFYTHDDMRRAWGGTNHTDPGPNFPKDILLQSVHRHLNPVVDPPKIVSPVDMFMIKPKRDDNTVFLTDGKGYVRPIKDYATMKRFIKLGIPFDAEPIAADKLSDFTGKTN